MSYQIKGKENKTPTDWEREQFQMLGKITYQVKRTFPIKPDSTTFYPRFQVTEEVYETEEKAVLRGKRIGEKPPDLSVEEREYWMVNGFRHKNIVYFISTDAVIFYESLADFTRKFHNIIRK